MKTLLLLSLMPVVASAAAGSVCEARSGAVAPTIVELYTSEGCSSCPPADRWLSTLKGQPGVLPLAFHVNYWDKLGWVDRFATPEATSRQYALAHATGGDSVYTPQVRVNGRDQRAGVSLPPPAPSPLAVSLVREGGSVSVTVDGTKSATRLEGYWAVVEDQYESRVRAGENAGETLRHDHVVRLYKPVAAWSASEGLKARIDVSGGAPDHPRRVVFVVTDPATQRPLQAAALAC